MCGIVGYIGFNQAADFLLDGMAKLEYRGYDSAGIAVIGANNVIKIQKKVGRLANLEAIVKQDPNEGVVGIGHTRWATHGRPSDMNSHPHADENMKFAVVHNGIIENYMPLKEELLQKGYHFKSETDTEVIAHLLADMYDGNFEGTVRRMLDRVDGAYALEIICADEPDKIICTKKENPLVIGLGKGENFVASDIPAIINYTRDTYILSDGEIAIVTKDSVSVSDRAGNPINKKVFHVIWNAEAAEKGGYEHFMLKEIHDQPKAVRDTFGTHISEDMSQALFSELNWEASDVDSIKNILIVACGTAYHAGLVTKKYIESLARIPVNVEIASEYRYSNPLTDSSTLCIVISQSGETSDTLAALKEAKRLGARSLAITNVVGSSISREADQTVYTWAGPEISVASTKAYTTQLVAGLLFAVYLGQLNGKLDAALAKDILIGIHELPELIHTIFEVDEDMKAFAKHYGFKTDAFFLGRSIDYAVAMEGALKLKEISYIHAEAYAGGELKHGTLALIEEGVPVIALATQEDVFDKMISNIREVKAREAVVIGIGMKGDEEIAKHVDHTIYIPRANKFIAPILAVVPLQLLAYYAAITRGADVDKPRNLAKSVTVE
ncbi:glutamine--fructose-6-phosphate transaminase (isomerizing) [Veillonella sp. YH-vei2232]|jgi:glucosamine--fructose-6-phosphate aminotransferase (isomerizing)|uniref:Glutamine--fructose-6-phosphate aminotransferase [isomerizing] n=1 Tax=Veillonella absiana TaxID=3079305 RepID=A0ABU3Z687_9FIRM|nr:MULTISPECIES: glutamine--fructose-6-phosphate transaminase (isomerizing) [unclassified Veillonella]MBP6922999.1 glutamine--fructose-6-phosphate transaminase (isomerizing) [Veillonella sp.]MBP9516659.1 glutamine--fructose-6-phosphate transaminase (isomerizing) [Veillonella sp.]MDV5063452.1 glutamine--fructose-6-phosphate transaminase (isomerizing) [Veillonella sp. YH-vei2232]MDV5087438.1 glutamine--fructose-6-phosphate transaminase (isomerizing) [Veillonella sp. YH-vei2233]